MFSPNWSHWMSLVLLAVLVTGCALLPPSSAPLHSSGTGRGEAKSKQGSCDGSAWDRGNILPRSGFRAMFEFRMRLLLIRVGWLSWMLSSASTKPRSSQAPRLAWQQGAVGDRARRAASMPRRMLQSTGHGAEGNTGVIWPRGEGHHSGAGWALLRGW